VAKTKILDINQSKTKPTVFKKTFFKTEIIKIDIGFNQRYTKVVGHWILETLEYKPDQV